MAKRDGRGITQPFVDRAESTRPVVGRYPDGVFLEGSRCVHCQANYFPPAEVCISCRGTDFEAAQLAGRGRLYSYSTVHVSSTKPVPYTIGYVDLDSGVRVLARLSLDPPLAFDVPVELASDSTDSNWYFVRSTEDNGTGGGAA